jgi:branched-chain amino acid transport system substrate-binding protein
VLQYDLIPEGRHPEMVYVKVNTKVADEMTSQIAQLKGCDVVIIGGLLAYFNPIYTAMQSNPATRGIPTIASYVNIALTNIPTDVVAQPDTSDIYGGAWVVIDAAAQNERQATEIQEFRDVLAWGKGKGYISPADHDAYVGSPYSMSSYIALKVFSEGMIRLAGKEITRDAFLAAMESERINVPISGGVDYSNGQRIGLDGMAFAKFNKGFKDAFDAFFTVDGMKSITELLGE